MAGVPVFILILGNQLLAAAGVAGEGIAGQGIIRPHNAQLHQRGNRGDKARCMAAGVCDALCGFDGLAVADFSKAVNPVGVGAVGGGSVDDAGGGIFHQRHSFHGRGVRQAQENNIRRVHEFGALHAVFALILVNKQQLDILAAAQPPVNLQAGGAFLAVNINFRFHGETSLLLVHGPVRTPSRGASLAPAGQFTFPAPANVFL